MIDPKKDLKVIATSATPIYNITLFKNGVTKLCMIEITTSDINVKDLSRALSTCDYGTKIVALIDLNIKILDVVNDRSIRINDRKHAMLIRWLNISFDEEEKRIVAEYKYKNNVRMKWDYEIPLSTGKGTDADMKDLRRFNSKIVERKIMRSYGETDDFEYAKIRIKKPTSDKLLLAINEATDTVFTCPDKYINIIKIPVYLGFKDGCVEVIWMTQFITICIGNEDCHDFLEFKTRKFVFTQKDSDIKVGAILSLVTAGKFDKDSSTTLTYDEAAEKIKELSIQQLTASAIVSTYSMLENYILPMFGIVTMCRIFDLFKDDNTRMTFDFDPEKNIVEITVEGKISFALESYDKKRVKKIRKVLSDLKINIFDDVLLSVNKFTSFVSVYTANPEEDDAVVFCNVTEVENKSPDLIPVTSYEKLPMRIISFLLFPLMAIGTLVMSILTFFDRDKIVEMAGNRSGRAILRLLGAIVIAIIELLFLLG